MPVDGKIQRFELPHFGIELATRNKFLARIRPTVRDLARKQIRKPKDVARALNALGVRTALRARWNPRLCRFLLGYLFERPGTKKQPRRAAVYVPADPSLSAAAPKASPKPRPPLATLSTAEKLATLGKVSARRRA